MNATTNSSGSHLYPAVVSAKKRLAEGREKLKAQHDAGSPGVQVCARLTDLIDKVVLDLFQAAVGVSEVDPEMLQRDVALVAHGGYGRRDVAPYSDVDLMVLHTPSASARLLPLIRRFTQSIYDTGLQLGFSARTPLQARRLALKDATIFTSLSESRQLTGEKELFNKFFHKFRRDAQRRSRFLVRNIEEARREERRKFGETVFLLRPNIKRSRGGLRDIQLVRWVGFARFGNTDPEHLFRAGKLSPEDRSNLRAATEFLLRLRNELHFCAGKPVDILERSEQVRIAELCRYEAHDGMLPVEEFMRDYFDHTSNVRYTSAHFVADARNRGRVVTLLNPLLSHQVEDDFRVGPIHIGATRRALPKIQGDLVQVLRLMDLANLYNKRIDHRTWHAIRESMLSDPPQELSAEAAERFISLMSQTGRLGSLLRRLHQLRVLEKIVPAVQHARCLLQFNEYHKYTVDEHSLRAVEKAVSLVDEPGPLGDAYREIKRKYLLHLALLVHDLGKGFPEDHSELGAKLAVETGTRLQLPQRDTEAVRFLVLKHLTMPHLAFRRDIDDESVVVQFAVEVGSPEVLKMLYVLSAADLAAVGPGVLNDWKLNLLTELYRRTMRHLVGDRRRTDDELERLRGSILAKLPKKEDGSWWEQQLQLLPASYLGSESPEKIVEELHLLRQLSPNDAVAWGRYCPERNAVEYTVGTHDITSGVFHRLTGVLASKGHDILGAEINTLAKSTVLDRFYVHDLDFSGEPPEERREEVCAALIKALKKPTEDPPTFRRTWQTGEDDVELQHLPTRVRFDNTAAENSTIIDIFAHDRVGLLYTITRTLFELGLSVSVAKIGTYLDQVVDVFYVAGPNGQKIEDEKRIAEIRESLLNAIEPAEAI